MRKAQLYIKSKCPDCNPSKGDPAHFGILRINSLSPSNRNAVLKISINGVPGTAFADSGASHSIAGETLYTILLQQGAAFEKTIIKSVFFPGHFWLNGYVNKQNCRIWSEAYPQVYVETPLHPEKLTVWCPLWAGGIIGPYFFKKDEGHNVTVNGDRYRAMITNFFIPELNNHDVQELWFQQDGATCHTARATIDLLKDTFGYHLISRFGPVNWPPRSCDLTPLDYFL
ncbi:DUF4817 domain-containing protein [Trichonephila clavipes]|uniref:DUF4817 domain-containing protein n=1 Tax=Trichonephila clavipes TaxID=2585209 RepID=A0A8X6RE77_TRICX|nr:DUF4817 domain-containing protein [Trichonephila clavipes]